MPITQSRMIALIDAAEALEQGGRKIASAVEAAIRAQVQGGDPRALLQSIEWCADYEAMVDQWTKHKTTVMIEGKWFERFARANDRKADRQRRGQVCTRDPGGPIYRQFREIPRDNREHRLRGQSARASAEDLAKLRAGPEWKPVGLAENLQINEFMRKNSGVDREAAKMMLGFEHEVVDDGGPEAADPEAETQAPFPPPTHLAPDDDIEDFGGLGEDEG